MGKGAGGPVGKGWLDSRGPEKDEGPISGNALSYIGVTRMARGVG